MSLIHLSFRIVTQDWYQWIMMKSLTILIRICCLDYELRHLVRRGKCFIFASTWVRTDGIRVAHLVSFSCCSIMCLYVLSSVLLIFLIFCVVFFLFFFVFVFVLYLNIVYVSGMFNLDCPFAIPWRLFTESSTPHQAKLAVSGPHSRGKCIYNCHTIVVNLPLVNKWYELLSSQ
jgi:hypothetical protein